MSTQDLSFAEKDFYLDEFHGKSLLFALRAADLAMAAEADVAGEVSSSLLSNETRVLLLIETSGEEEHRLVEALCNRLACTVKTPPVPLAVLPVDVGEDLLLAQIWAVLRVSPLFIGLWPANPGVSLVACAQRVAVRLKVHKLVLLDPAGGITTCGIRVSVINRAALHEILYNWATESAGIDVLGRLVQACRGSLAGGEP